jgi:hypothetical protein
LSPCGETGREERNGKKKKKKRKKKVKVRDWICITDRPGFWFGSATVMVMVFPESCSINVHG